MKIKQTLFVSTILLSLSFPSGALADSAAEGPPPSGSVASLLTQAETLPAQLLYFTVLAKDLEGMLSACRGALDTRLELFQSFSSDKLKRDIIKLIKLAKVIIGWARLASCYIELTSCPTETDPEDKERLKTNLMYFDVAFPNLKVAPLNIENERIQDGLTLLRLENEITIVKSQLVPVAEKIVATEAERETSPDDAIAGLAERETVRREPERDELSLRLKSLQEQLSYLKANLFKEDENEEPGLYDDLPNQNYSNGDSGYDGDMSGEGDED